MPDTAPPRPTTPPPAMPRPAPRARWTASTIRIFLTVLSETGNVTHSAAMAGMSRTGAQKLRQRLAGQPFDEAWDRAIALYNRMIADPYFASADQQARRAHGAQAARP